MTMMLPVVMLAETYVSGHPKTKGSLEVVTTKHVREKPGSARWRAIVADALRRDFAKRGECGPYAERVGILIVSYLQPPQTWRQRMAEWMLGQYSSDADKLARNVLDAAVDAGVIVDDGQVVDLYSHKRLCSIGSIPGQRIQIWATPKEHEW